MSGVVLGGWCLACFSWGVVRFFQFCFVLHSFCMFHFDPYFALRLKISHFLKLSETKELEYTWNWPSSCTSLFIFSPFNDICEQIPLIVWVIKRNADQGKIPRIGFSLMKFWKVLHRAKIPLLSGHDFSCGHRRWCDARLEPHVAICHHLTSVPRWTDAREMHWPLVFIILIRSSQHDTSSKHKLSTTWGISGNIYIELGYISQRRGWNWPPFTTRVSLAIMTTCSRGWCRLYWSVAMSCAQLLRTTNGDGLNFTGCG